MEGICSSEQLCGGIVCSCLVTEKIQTWNLASLFSTNVAYLILSPDQASLKHWHYLQGAREETGKEARCRGRKVWKQPGACAISSFWEAEGHELSWCLLFRDMFMMHLSRELQQGLSFAWRWFSCVFCLPWEKIPTLGSGESWTPSLFLGIASYCAWGMGHIACNSRRNFIKSKKD